MATGMESAHVGLPPETGWRPLEEVTLAPERAGTLRALREAEDDAQTIRAFLRSGMATRDLDPDQVLWIIDLAPGNGERAWRVLRQLASVRPRSPPLRYLACCRTEAQYQHLANHPCLQSLIACGSLFLNRDGSGVPSHPVRNPIVVLAHDGFSAQAQALYAVRHGELLEAGSDHAGALLWRAFAGRDGLSPLLSAYRQSLNSAAFTVPREAIATVARLLQVSGGRLLLRACDRGAKDLAQIRMGALQRVAGQPLPVNFEIMARWHRANCGNVQQLQRDDAGRVLHLAVHDIPSGHLRACLPEVLALAHPDDHAQLLDAMNEVSTLSPAQGLAMLHAQGGDVRALAGLAARITALIPTLSGAALRQWREMLAQCWSQFYPPQTGSGDDHLRSLIGTLAMALQNWPLARTVLRAQWRDAPRDAGCWRGLAQCQSRTGGTRAALRSLAQAQTLGDQSSALRQCMAALVARRAAWNKRPAYREALARDGRLVLEPLDSDHAADFLRQYRDPQIGLMARLPAFADSAALHGWMEQRADDGQRADYAVVHADRGFVGAVGAHWQVDSAFIHFWLGADHQGAGLSARAVRLLLRQLCAYGVEHVFAAVHPDNHRSLRCLQRAGFSHLPIKAMAPDQALLFLGWGRDAGSTVSTLCQCARTVAQVTASSYIFIDDSVRPAVTRSDAMGVGTIPVGGVDGPAQHTNPIHDGID